MGKSIPLCFFDIACLFAQRKEYIVSHKGETIVTDYSKGSNSYKREARFPQRGIPVRQILLYLTLECPDTMRCTDGDYSGHIMASPKNDSTRYEIARFITPYGNQHVGRTYLTTLTLKEES